jgi:hypothetical protein
VRDSAALIEFLDGSLNFVELPAFCLDESGDGLGRKE